MRYFLRSYPKKEHILHRHADIIPQVIKIHVADIHTIHKYLSRSRIIKPAEQIHDR